VDGAHGFERTTEMQLGPGEKENRLTTLYEENYDGGIALSMERAEEIPFFLNFYVIKIL